MNIDNFGEPSGGDFIDTHFNFIRLHHSQSLVNITKGHHTGTQMNDSAFESFGEEAQQTLDFTRCQRSDGSYYGTGGQCRKGAPVADKEKNLKVKQSAMMKAEKKATAAMQAHRADPENQAKKDTFRVATMDARNAKDARDIAAKALDKAKKAEAPSARTQNRLEVERAKEREAKMNKDKEKRDASKDLKNRRGETVGTSPRNMMIDNRDAMQKRLDGSTNESERKILKQAIGKIDKKLASDKSSGVSMTKEAKATKAEFQKRKEASARQRAVTREMRPKVRELDKQAKDLNKQADRLESALKKQRKVTQKNPTRENKARLKAVLNETRTADRAAQQADKVADKASAQFTKALKKAGK